MTLARAGLADMEAADTPGAWRPARGAALSGPDPVPLVRAPCPEVTQQRSAGHWTQVPRPPPSARGAAAEASQLPL